MGEPAAGAAHAGLHLVEDQQQLVLVAQLAQAFEVAGRRQVDAAFALDRLDQDRARSRRRSASPSRVEVAERGVVEARQHRLDARVILRLAGRGQRSHRPAVEAVEHGDDLVAASAVPLSRASLIAASFASVPLLQKKHWPAKSVRSLSAWASSPAARCTRCSARG